MNNNMMRGQAALQAESAAINTAVREIRQGISPEIVKYLQDVSGSLKQLADNSRDSRPRARRIENRSGGTMIRRLEVDEAVEVRGISLSL